MDERFKTPAHIINMISNRLRRSADENLARECVTVEQVRIMKMIHDNGGCVGQKEIEKAFEVRRSTVTSAMQLLEKKGYIERYPHPDDMRAKIVTLTESGNEKNEKLIDFIKSRDEKLLSGLTEGEIETLTSLLVRLCDNL